MQKVFENEFGKGYIPDDDLPKCLIMEWIGFWETNYPNLKVALDFSLAYIKEHQIFVLISDCTQLETLSDEVRDFLNDYWYPTATKEGLKMEIYIAATDLISKISLEMLFEEVSQDFDGLIAINANDLAQAKLVAKKFLENQYQL